MITGTELIDNIRLIAKADALFVFCAMNNLALTTTDALSRIRDGECLRLNPTHAPNACNNRLSVWLQLTLALCCHLCRMCAAAAHVTTRRILRSRPTKGSIARANGEAASSSHSHFDEEESPSESESYSSDHSDTSYTSDVSSDYSNVSYEYDGSETASSYSDDGTIRNSSGTADDFETWTTPDLFPWFSGRFTLARREGADAFLTSLGLGWVQRKAAMALMATQTPTTDIILRDGRDCILSVSTALRSEKYAFRIDGETVFTAVDTAGRPIGCRARWAKDQYGTGGAARGASTDPRRAAEFTRGCAVLETWSEVGEESSGISLVVRRRLLTSETREGDINVDGLEVEIVSMHGELARGWHPGVRFGPKMRETYTLHQ
jgi:hypothetical protein